MRKYFDVELDGMAELGYYGIGPFSDVIQSWSRERFRLFVIN